MSNNKGRVRQGYIRTNNKKVHTHKDPYGKVSTEDVSTMTTSAIVSVGIFLILGIISSILFGC